MKTYLTVLFAATMLASAALGSDGDPFQEQRFKAKTGRNTPAEETRLKALAQPSTDLMKDCMSNCDRQKHATAKNQATAKAESVETESFFDAWSRAKWGRNIREERGKPEIQLVQAHSGLAATGMSCEHPQCCD